MNRRQLLAAGAAGVAGLLVPSVAGARPKYETLKEYLLRTLPKQYDRWHFYDYWCLNPTAVVGDGKRPEYGYVVYCRAAVEYGADLNYIKGDWCIRMEGGWHYVNPQTLELIPYTPPTQTALPV